MQTPLMFDGHNDLLLRIHSGNVPFGIDGFQGGGGHQVDLEKARAGGFAGGFFAIFVPSEDGPWIWGK